ncbi:hypothetical protein [Streptomyces poonensis]|uniref:Uncharacterized protein n=1 Tax=Streptomyces poonensis TaxID=68255 RepID=A0A918PCL8_9ACTN|nr:hypothetical protein [Streptomyces poonensis]GGY99813.1 hypothetical protein GCM10010365_18190 [Streptomyces poonensis]GLJ92192.1 hypothetical protein GCM10017589_48010 [Streptomyces poonensis]
MHEAPIYAQLIRERGDIPLQAREEARRIQRELDRVLNMDVGSAGLAPRPAAPSAPALPPSGSGSAGGWFS